MPQAEGEMPLPGPSRARFHSVSRRDNVLGTPASNLMHNHSDVGEYVF